MNRRSLRTCWPRLLALLVLPLVFPACFSERSFPAVESRLMLLTDRQAHTLDSYHGQLSTSEWAVAAHKTMAGLLPAFSRDALTPANMVDANKKPVDVFGHMGLNPANMDILLLNLEGLQQSAQVSSPPPTDDCCAPWPGFESVRIPVTNGDLVCARLAAPLKNDLGGSYIVFTHGLFGTMAGLDVQNHIAALRNAGHHVLALEMRGHGATISTFPKLPITFGVFEAPDLLAVARWLKTEKHAERVGLVSFSMTAYEAILAAYLDGGGLREKSMHESPLFKGVPEPDAAPAFNAGMFLLSPPVNFVESSRVFDTEYTLWTGAVKSVFQAKAAARMAERGEKPSYKLWEFAAAEINRSGLPARFAGENLVAPAVNAYLDVKGSDWAEGHRRLDFVRAPLLVLEAANDPLATAQAVADLFGGAANPNCAAIILPQGGHMGFAAVSADYYYSMMLSFFNSKTGPGIFTSPVAAAAKK